MSDLTPLDVLIAHQRQDISSCQCGWSELGHSFCQHQIDALNAAGFVTVRKPTGDDRVMAVARAIGLEPTKEAYDAMAAALDAADCTCGRVWEGHPQPHSIICKAYPAADGRTPVDAEDQREGIPDDAAAGPTVDLVGENARLRSTIDYLQGRLERTEAVRDRYRLAWQSARHRAGDGIALFAHVRDSRQLFRDRIDRVRALLDDLTHSYPSPAPDTTEAIVIERLTAALDVDLDGESTDD